MRLYYMTTLETLEQFILPEQQIRISTFNTVNDPFELLGAIRGGKVGQRNFRWLRDHWTNTMGFISFSDNWRSPLMWAHYARNHTGVCLGLEMTEKTPLKMKYEPSRVALQVDFQRFENAANIELLENLVATKFQEWEYEHEWRILLPLEYDPKQSKPQYFYEQFTPGFELREIILGARCERSLQEVSNHVFGVTAPVTVKRARPAFDNFSMVQQKLQQPITVHPPGNFTKGELRLAAAKRIASARDAERALKRIKPI